MSEQPRQNIQEIEEVKRSINSKKYREALDRLQLIMCKPTEKSDKSDPRIYYFTALCLQGLNTDYSRALNYYNLALEKGFKTFWLFYNRGLLYIQLGDLEAARIDLDQAVSLNPSHREATRIRDDLISAHELNGNQEQLASPVVACCVGKSGTVLLANILESILGDNQVIPSKVFGKSLVTSEYLLAIPKLTNRVYIGHVWYSDVVAKKLASVPKIILIRDPRDNVVSYTHFMDRITKDVFGSAEESWDKKEWDEKLSSVIFGFKTAVAKVPSVYDSYINYGIRWAGSTSFILRYEDIIGTKFGGNERTVIETMKSLMDFIGVQIDEGTLARKIAEGSDPAKSGTFRSGGQGNWRHEFTPLNVKQMKIAAPGLVSSLGYEQDENWDIYTSIKNTTNKFALYQIDDRAVTTLVSKTKSLDWDHYVDIRNELAGDISINMRGHHPIDEWAFNIFNEGQQIENALRILEQRLLISVPADPRWNYFYAYYLHTLRRDLQKALQHYNIALENGFNEFWVKYNRGVLLKELGELNNARTDLERAVSLDPEFEAAHNILKGLKEQMTSNS